MVLECAKTAPKAQVSKIPCLASIIAQRIRHQCIITKTSPYLSGQGRRHEAKMKVLLAFSKVALLPLAHQYLLTQDGFYTEARRDRLDETPATPTSWNGAKS